jgi:hypothetical protein
MKTFQPFHESHSTNANRPQLPRLNQINELEFLCDVSAKTSGLSRLTPLWWAASLAIFALGGEI